MTDSPWAQLRRRKIVQWSLGYVAGAWALLQGLQFLTQTFGWPARLVQLATVGLGFGLAIAWVLAWYHGDRGQQRLSKAEAVIIAVLLTLGGGTVWQYGRVLDAREAKALAASAPASATAVAPRSPDRSVAVLPFANLSGDPDQDYLGDGLADTLIQQLAQVRELKVIARSSSFQFRGPGQDLPRVARQLGVGAILEGSVQRAGDRIRVSAQLVNVRDGSTFWNKVFDRQAADLFGIQDEIAQEVVRALKLILMSDAMAAPSVSPYRNLDAYEAYAKGRTELEKQTAESVVTARTEFTRATELDPDYALAFAGLAQSLVYLTWQGEDTLEPAKTAIDRAFHLDPSLAEAHAMRGLIKWEESDNEGAEAEYKRSIELAPGYATAHHLYSVLLQNQNRLSDAESMARKAVMLDPMSLDARYRLASNLRGLGRYDEMLAEALQAITIDPQFALGYILGSVYFHRTGRPADAVRWMRKAAAVDPANPDPAVYKYDVLAALEMDDEPDWAELENASRDGPNASLPDMMLASWHLRRRDWPAAAQSAARALEREPANGVAQYYAFESRLQQEGPEAALQLIEQTDPDLLADPPNHKSFSPFAPVAAARVLAAAGRQKEAHRLVGYSLGQLRAYSRGNWPGLDWLTVVAYAVIDRKAALARMRELVDGGLFIGWDILTESNASEALKGDPEFEHLLARLRAKAREVRADLARKPELTDADIGAAIEAVRRGGVAAPVREAEPAAANANEE